MKTTNQARKNGSASRAARQTKTTAKENVIAEPGLEDGIFECDSPVSLMLHDVRVDGFIAGVEISPAQLSALRRKAKSAGCSLSSLLRQAIDNLLTAAA